MKHFCTTCRRHTMQVAVDTARGIKLRCPCGGMNDYAVDEQLHQAGEEFLAGMGEIVDSGDE